jgi:hypothetical protein
MIEIDTRNFAASAVHLSLSGLIIAAFVVAV